MSKSHDFMIGARLLRDVAVANVLRFEGKWLGV